MPEAAGTKEAGTQKPSRPRNAAPLRSFIAIVLLPLRWLFRAMNGTQRAMLVRIPGVVAVYRSISRRLVSVGSEEGVACARVNGLKMYLDPAEEASHAGAFLWGEYEPATAAVFMTVVAEGDVVVDAGAHWGYFTLLAASLCGERGRVFAFEPHPGNYALLTKSVEANGLTNVVAVQKAVSDRSGSAKLFQAGVAAGHSLYSPTPDGGREGTPAHQAIDVATVALDDFFAQIPGALRLVKMDIEGSEPLALAGMQGLIGRSPALVLIMEFNPSFLHVKATSDILDQLAARGFDLGIIDDNRRQLIVGPKEAVLKRLFEKQDWANLLATRDRTLFERMFQQQNGFGKHLRRLERIRL